MTLNLVVQPTVMDDQEIFGGRIPMAVSQLLLQIGKTSFTDRREARINDFDGVVSADRDDGDRASTRRSKLLEVRHELTQAGSLRHGGKKCSAALVDEVGDLLPTHGHEIFQQLSVAASDEYLGFVLFGQFFCDADDCPGL